MLFVCLFFFNTISITNDTIRPNTYKQRGVEASSDLAPPLAVNEDEFREKFRTKSFLLAHEAVNRHIREQIEKITAVKGEEGVKKKPGTINVAGDEVTVEIIAVPLLLRRTGQFAHVGLGRQYGKPVIYIDETLFDDKDIIQHELDEISYWETYRVQTLDSLDSRQMRTWIRGHLTEAKELARRFHEKSHDLEALHNKYADIINFDYEYIGLMLDLYGIDEDSDDINIAAKKKASRKSKKKEVLIPAGKRLAIDWLIELHEIVQEHITHNMPKSVFKKAQYVLTPRDQKKCAEDMDKFLEYFAQSDSNRSAKAFYLSALNSYMDMFADTHYPLERYPLTKVLIRELERMTGLKYSDIVPQFMRKYLKKHKLNDADVQFVMQEYSFISLLRGIASGRPLLLIREPDSFGDIERMMNDLDKASSTGVLINLPLTPFSDRSQLIGGRMPVGKKKKGEKKQKFEYYTNIIPRLVKYAADNPGKQIYLVLDNIDSVTDETRVMINEFVRTGTINIPELGEKGKIVKPDNLSLIATASASARIKDEAFFNRFTRKHYLSHSEIYLGDIMRIVKDVSGSSEVALTRFLMDDALPAYDSMGLELAPDKKIIITKADIYTLVSNVNGRLMDRPSRIGEHKADWICLEEFYYLLRSKITDPEWLELLREHNLFRSYFFALKETGYTYSFDAEKHTFTVDNVRIKVNPKIKDEYSLYKETGLVLDTPTLKMLSSIFRAFKYGNKMIILNGATGLGKTFTLRAFAKMIDAGFYGEPSHNGSDIYRWVGMVKSDGERNYYLDRDTPFVRAISKDEQGQDHKEVIALSELNAKVARDGSAALAWWLIPLAHGKEYIPLTEHPRPPPENGDLFDMIHRNNECFIGIDINPKDAYAARGFLPEPLKEAVTAVELEQDLSPDDVKKFVTMSLKSRIRKQNNITDIADFVSIVYITTQKLIKDKKIAAKKADILSKRELARFCEDIRTTVSKENPLGDIESAFNANFIMRFNAKDRHILRSEILKAESSVVLRRNIRLPGRARLELDMDKLEIQDMVDKDRDIYYTTKTGKISAGVKRTNDWHIEEEDIEIDGNAFPALENRDDKKELDMTLKTGVGGGTGPKVRSLAAMQDGRIVSISGVSESRIWDIDKNEVYKLVDNYSCAVVLPKGEIAASLNTSYDAGTIMLFDNIDTEAERIRVRSIEIPGTSNASAIFYDETSNSIITGHVNGEVSILELSDEGIVEIQTLYPEQKRHEHEPVSSVSVLPDGRIVSCSQWEFVIKIWDRKKSEVKLITAGPDDYKKLPLGVDVYPDGRIVSCHADGTVRIWDIPRDDQSNHFQLLTPKRREWHSGRATALKVFPDGRIVTGGYDNTVRVWYPGDRKVVILKDHDKYISALGITPDGAVISGTALTGDENTIKIWNIPYGFGKDKGALTPDQIEKKLERDAIKSAMDGGRPCMIFYDVDMDYRGLIQGLVDEREADLEELLVKHYTDEYELIGGYVPTDDSVSIKETAILRTVSADVKVEVWNALHKAKVTTRTISKTLTQASRKELLAFTTALKSAINGEDIKTHLQWQDGVLPKLIRAAQKSKKETVFVMNAYHNLRPEVAVMLNEFLQEGLLYLLSLKQPLKFPKNLRIIALANGESFLPISLAEQARWVKVRLTKDSNTSIRKRIENLITQNLGNVFTKRDRETLILDLTDFVVDMHSEAETLAHQTKDVRIFVNDALYLTDIITKKVAENKTRKGMGEMLYRTTMSVYGVKFPGDIKGIFDEWVGNTAHATETHTDDSDDPDKSEKITKLEFQMTEESAMLSKGRSAGVIPRGKFGLKLDTGRYIIPQQGIPPEELHYILNNSDRVESVVTLPDDRVVSGDYEGFIRIWDIANDKVFSFKGHDQAVKSIAVMDDGRIASCGYDHTIKLWDIDNESQLKPFQMIDESSRGTVFLSIAAVPNSKAVITGDLNGNVVLWDFETNTALPFGQHAKGIQSIKVLSDGRVVSACTEKIKIWNYNMRKVYTLVHDLPGSEPIEDIAILHDGSIASSHQDGTVRIWDINNKNFHGTHTLSVIEADKHWITSVLGLPDGRIVLGTTEGDIKLCDPEEGAVEKFGKQTDSISDIALSPDGKIVSGSANGKIMVWELPDEEKSYGNIEPIQKSESYIKLPLEKTTSARMPKQVDGTEHGELFIEVMADNTERKAGAGKTGLQYTFSGHTMEDAAVWGVSAISDDRVLSYDSMGVMRTWNVKTKQEISWSSHQWFPIHDAFEVPDGTGRIVSAGALGKISISDKEAKKVFVYDDRFQAVTINSIGYLPDGRIVSGDDKGNIKVWNLLGDGEKSVRLINGHTKSIRSLCVISDSIIVTGSADNTVKVWDISDLENIKVHTLKGHEMPVNSVAVLPDGRIVSGSEDKTIKVWEADEGSGEIKVITLEGHTREVVSVSVNWDGKIVSTGGKEDETVRVWDLEEKSTIAMRGHKDRVLKAVFLPDGRIASGSIDQTVNLWNPPLLILRDQEESLVNYEQDNKVLNIDGVTYPVIDENRIPVDEDEFLVDVDPLVEVERSMLLAWKHRKMSILIGPPGVGKTEMAADLANRVGLPHFTFQMRKGIDLTDWLGRFYQDENGNFVITTRPYIGDDGKLHYREKLLDYMLNGGVFIIDEGALGKDAERMLQWFIQIAQGIKKVRITEHPSQEPFEIDISPNFHAVITSNPIGKTAMRRPIPLEIIANSQVINVPGNFSERDLIKILAPVFRKSNLKLTEKKIEDLCRRMIATHTALKDAIGKKVATGIEVLKSDRYFVSLRELKNWAKDIVKFYEHTGDVEKAAKIGALVNYLSMFSAGDRKKLMDNFREFYMSVEGQKIKKIRGARSLLDIKLNKGVIKDPFYIIKEGELDWVDGIKTEENALKTLFLSCASGRPVMMLTEQGARYKTIVEKFASDLNYELHTNACNPDQTVVDILGGLFPVLKDDEDDRIFKRKEGFITRQLDDDGSSKVLFLKNIDALDEDVRGALSTFLLKGYIDITADDGQTTRVMKPENLFIIASVSVESDADFSSAFYNRFNRLRVEPVLYGARKIPRRPGGTQGATSPADPLDIDKLRKINDAQLEILKQALGRTPMQHEVHAAINEQANDRLKDLLKRQLKEKAAAMAKLSELERIIISLYGIPGEAALYIRGIYDKIKTFNDRGAWPSNKKYVFTIKDAILLGSYVRNAIITATIREQKINIPKIVSEEAYTLFGEALEGRHNALGLSDKLYFKKYILNIVQKHRNVSEAKPVVTLDTDGLIRDVSGIPLSPNKGRAVSPDDIDSANRLLYVPTIVKTIRAILRGWQPVQRNGGRTGPRVVSLMGRTGVAKTTLGINLADALGMDYYVFPTHGQAREMDITTDVEMQGSDYVKKTKEFLSRVRQGNCILMVDEANIQSKIMYGILSELAAGKKRFIVEFPGEKEDRVEVGENVFVMLTMNPRGEYSRRQKLPSIVMEDAVKVWVDADYSPDEVQAIVKSFFGYITQKLGTIKTKRGLGPVQDGGGVILTPMKINSGSYALMGRGENKKDGIGDEASDPVIKRRLEMIRQGIEALAPEEVDGIEVADQWAYKVVYDAKDTAKIAGKIIQIGKKDLKKRVVKAKEEKYIDYLIGVIVHEIRHQRWTLVGQELKSAVGRRTRFFGKENAQALKAVLGNKLYHDLFNAIEDKRIDSVRIQGAEGENDYLNEWAKQEFSKTLTQKEVDRRAAIAKKTPHIIFTNEIFHYLYKKKFSKAFRKYPIKLRRALQKVKDKALEAAISKDVLLKSMNDPKERTLSQMKSLKIVVEHILPEYTAFVEESLKNMGKEPGGGKGETIVIDFDSLPDEIKKQIQEALKNSQVSESNPFDKDDKGQKIVITGLDIEGAKPGGKSDGDGTGKPGKAKGGEAAQQPGAPDISLEDLFPELTGGHMNPDERSDKLNDQKEDITDSLNDRLDEIETTQPYLYNMSNVDPVVVQMSDGLVDALLEEGDEDYVWMSSGRGDELDFRRVAQGHPKPFKRRIESEKYRKTSFEMCIDLSISMGMVRGLQEAVLASAALFMHTMNPLAEELDEIEYAVSGFHTSYVPMKEYGETVSEDGLNEKLGMVSNHYATGSTDITVALNMIIDKLKSQDGLKIACLITDGYDNTNIQKDENGKVSAIGPLAEALQKAEENNIIIVGIGIGPKSMNCVEIFPHYAKPKKFEELPELFIRIVQEQTLAGSIPTGDLIQEFGIVSDRSKRKKIYSDIEKRQKAKAQRRSASSTKRMDSGIEPAENGRAAEDAGRRDEIDAKTYGLIDADVNRLKNMLNNVLPASMEEGRIYEIHYDTARLTPLQIAIIK